MVEISDVKIIRGRRTSIVLKILRDGSVEVKAPYLIPHYFINDFIQKNSEMIERGRNRVLQGLSMKKKYINGEKFLYLGKEYVFEIGNYTRIKIEKDKLLFPQALLFRAKQEIENWYIRGAKELINPYVETSALEMKTSFISINFSDTKSKWGSCTHDNRLQFNWRLIMAPLLVVRYVVIHELAHTKEKNHSRAFWSRVSAVNPSYKQQIKWLKENGNRLQY